MEVIRHLHTAAAANLYLLDRMLGGPQGQSGRRGEDNSCPAENRIRAVQYVTRRYPDSQRQRIAWLTKSEL
jgi:hypothetical protein